MRTSRLADSSSSSSMASPLGTTTMTRQEALLELEPAPQSGSSTGGNNKMLEKQQQHSIMNHNNDDSDEEPKNRGHDFLWLLICFVGIMISFVSHNLLMERAALGELHEMSFLLTSSFIAMGVALLGTVARGERAAALPLSSFAVLGLCNMGSSFFSVRSLRYVIFPVKVIAKSCKPVPVMLFGTCMGKRYPMRKFINVFFIVFGVALVLGGGDFKKKSHHDNEIAANAQVLGVVMLVISLCFDGGLGAFEDKLVAAHNIQPLNLMYNIHLANITFAAIALFVTREMHLFFQMIRQMGWTLLLIGFCGAMGQVFIFITISKFGAVTSSIMGLARKVTTICASIYIYGHQLHWVQALGIFISLFSMSGHPVFCCLLNNFGERDYFYRTGLIGYITSAVRSAVSRSPGKTTRDNITARSSLAAVFLAFCVLLQFPQNQDFVRQLAAPLYSSGSTVPTSVDTNALSVVAVNEPKAAETVDQGRPGQPQKDAAKEQKTHKNQQKKKGEAADAQVSKSLRGGEKSKSDEKSKSEKSESTSQIEQSELEKYEAGRRKLEKWMNSQGGGAT